MPLGDLIPGIGNARTVQVSRDFVRWWVGELTGLWQDARERLWPQSRRPIRVTPDDDSLPIDLKGRTAIIVLPESLGLVKPIRLPRMARAHVRYDPIASRARDCRDALSVRNPSMSLTLRSILRQCREGVKILLLVAPLAALAGTVTYEYDDVGRLKRVIREDGTHITYILDAAGNRSSMVTTPPPGTLQLTASTFAVAENGGSLNISVSRAGGSYGAASVNYATTNGTATAGSDYTTASGTLNWTNGDAATKSFSIPLLDDAVYEGDETINITLSGATGSSQGSPATAVVTITENEAPTFGTLSLSPSGYSVLEAATTVTVNVARTGGAFGAVSVQYATSNGTASSGSDYTTTSGTLNWANGDAATKSFSVTILDDSTGEANETVTLTLSNATGGAVLGTASGSITINDNETGSLQLSSSGYAVAEPDGSVILTVTRTNGSYGAASINYATANGTAIAGSDYTAASGTLNWASGDAASKTFSVPITNDTTYEPTAETFTATVSGASGASAGTPNAATVSITSEDAAQSGTLALSPSTYAVLEAATTVTVSVTRTGGSDLPVSVQYATSNGTATAGSDYTTTSGTLNWANGDAATKTFAVTILDDSTGESSETVTLTLSNVTGGAVLGTSTGTVTINDNEPGSLQFSASDFPVAETAGSVTITVTRTNGSYGAASINYATANGTALAGSDYTATSGTLNWSAGDAASKTFAVSITNDSIYEGTAETIALSLSGASGASLGSPSSATASITSEDPAVPGTLTLSPSTYGVLEGGGSVAVTVTRTGGSDLPVSVQYATSDGSAIAGNDYTPASGTLNWAHGDSASKTFNVGITNDNFGEPSEAVNLTLSNVGGGATLGTSTGSITITDDEPGTLTIVGTYPVSEAVGSFTATVTRTNGSYGAVTADYSTANGSATAGSDYVATSGTFSWANGDTSNRTFSVTIIDDAVVDPSEIFELRLTNATGGAYATYQLDNVIITDNESAVPGPPTINGAAHIYRIQGQNYTVSWTTVSGATSYELHQSINFGAFSPTYTGTGTSKLFTNPSVGDYQYKAKACNASGCSVFSNLQTVHVCASECQ